MYIIYLYYTIYYVRDGGEDLLKGWLVEGAVKVNKKRRPLLRKSMRPTFAGLLVNVMRNPHIYTDSVLQNLANTFVHNGRGEIGRLTVMSEKLKKKKNQNA